MEAPFTLKWSGHVLPLGKRTHIIGILNVTPDSFSDGGRYLDRDEAIRQGLRLAEDGADIIDVGGESTRPYAKRISVGEEIDRVIPVIAALRDALSLPISIDTFKAGVAREALRAGASIINDISALRFDPEMVSTAARAGVPIILMHMKGTPTDMQKNPAYENLIPEIIQFLRGAKARATAGGIEEEMILLDPGIGFGKTFDHNLQIIRELAAFCSLGRPLVLGSSRKAFLGHILNKEPQERDMGTMATIAAGVMNGANIVRVHNVKMALDTVRVIDAVKRGSACQTGTSCGVT